MNAVNEDEILEQEEATEDTREADAAIPELEFEEELYRLTTRQKILVAVGLVVSFLVFSLVLFPKDVFLRVLLARVASQVRIDFTSASPGFFAQTFQSLRVGLPDGTGFIADELESSHRVWDLVRGSLQGEINLKGADITTNVLSVRAGSGVIKSSLTGITEGVTSFRGELDIRLSNVTLERMPPEMSALVPIDMSKVKIEAVQIPLNFKENGITMQNGLIASNLFTLRMSGSSKYAGSSLDGLQLDGKICIRPDKNLEQNNPDVFGMYVFAGGSAGGDLCFSVKGPLNRPQFNKE